MIDFDQPVPDPTLAAEIRKHLREILGGDESAKQRLEVLLEPYQLTLDAVSASAFEMSIKSQVHTDRMVAAVQARRAEAYAAASRLRARRGRAAQTKTGAPPLSPSGDPAGGLACASEAAHASEGR